MKKSVLLFTLFFSLSSLLFGETAPEFQPQGRNLYSFDSVKTKFIRLSVDGGNTEPCIDEWEVFSPDSQENGALASKGVKATASSCMQGNPQHKVEHINDGIIGNASSWIPEGTTGWIQLEFPEPISIHQIALSRDRVEQRRGGQNRGRQNQNQQDRPRPLRDRILTALEISVSDDGENWTSVKKIDRFAHWMASNNNDRPVNTPVTVRRAVLDMIQEYGDRYPNGQQTLAELDKFDKRFAETNLNSPEGENLRKEFEAFQRNALLANPVLDFDKILAVHSNRMAAPGDNFMTMEKIPKQGHDNELVILSNLRGEPTMTTVYRTENGRPIGEPELHWDGKRVMFSSISEDNKHWAIFEVNLDGTGLKTLTPTDQPDIDFFDSCYAPDGTIITGSTASMQGLPCLNGSDYIANLYKVDPVTKNVRQLTFDQDTDNHPVMMRDGRVMYVRWEYADMMHYYSRILFQMNPDGTAQRELYGSGSYFPTAMKHPREIPGTSEIILILGGHHGRGDTGRLAIIDPAVARKYPFEITPKTKEWGVEGAKINVETDVLPASQTGFIQEIPGYGLDVVGNVLDTQSSDLKYNFVFPYPLSKNYFLVNCQVAGDGKYGLYLVDRFDNMTLIKRPERQGLFFPIPLKDQEPPQLLTDRTIPDSKTANVFITNIYDGVGTQGVPAGSIKKLRVYAYHFAYLRRGGHESLGVQSGWDIKRILGEVPVEADGSVTFEIPANMPIGLQPLDEQGKAVQIMRSWFVGMPGENVSCNGCHESQLDVTPTRTTIASRKRPEKIEPFYGPARNVAFETEVYYPLVQKYCMDCHNDNDGKMPSRYRFTNVDQAYHNIHPFVRRPGPETEMDVLRPMEYHVSTSELVRMLEKNHFNVKPDEEALRRLYLWIDLNAPLGGAWNNTEIADRRKEIDSLYTIRVEDNDSDFDQLLKFVRNNPPQRVPVTEKFVEPTDSAANQALFAELAAKKQFPFGADVAKSMQESAAVGGAVRKTIALSPDLNMSFVRIPAGTFVLGELSNVPDSSPRSMVKIDKPFWMSETEITNAQYALFDPNHDTRYIEEHGKDHVVPGYIANHPNQPVARISWQEAMRFAGWVTQQYNVSADLPTEAEWEWAARAGSGTQFFYGTVDTDFSEFANLAGAERQFLRTSWIDSATLHRRNPYPNDWVYPLRDSRFRDSWFIADYVAQYKPNAWGLYDMVGNVSEWTKSSYRPYPYEENDGRNNADTLERKTARGGSWSDRPKSAGSAVRYPYEYWQKAHDVGFRIILKSE